MTRHHSRAARRERQAAALLGTTRVVRAIGSSAPDVEPATLPSGAELQPEVKERARPLATLERWLAQAERYSSPDAIPCTVVFATGQPADEAIVALRLRDFRRVVGLSPADEQLLLPLARGGSR